MNRRDTMLARLLLVIFGFVVSWVVLRGLRPHPLRALPWRWRRLALRDPRMAQALRLRRNMVDLLLAGRAREAAALVHDVDRLLAALADAVQTRLSLRGLPAGAAGAQAEATEAAIAAAMAQLEAAHGQLVDLARAEIDAAVRDVRLRLGEHTEELRREVEARREVEELLAFEPRIDAAPSAEATAPVDAAPPREAPTPPRAGPDEPPGPAQGRDPGE